MSRNPVVWIRPANLGEPGGLDSGRQETREWMWLGAVRDSCSSKPRLMKDTVVEQMPKSATIRGGRVKEEVGCWERKQLKLDPV